jgi:hypothetical protein
MPPAPSSAAIRCGVITTFHNRYGQRARASYGSAREGKYGTAPPAV